MAIILPTTIDSKVLKAYKILKVGRYCTRVVVVRSTSNFVNFPSCGDIYSVIEYD